MKNRGDKIAAIAQPIARSIDKVFGTDIEGCAGCKKMRHDLNLGMSFADAFYDRFWRSNNTKVDGTNIMQYIVNRTQNDQIAIEANDPKEAIAKARNGEGMVTSSSENFGATPRPQPQPPR